MITSSSTLPLVNGVIPVLFIQNISRIAEGLGELNKYIFVKEFTPQDKKELGIKLEGDYCAVFLNESPELMKNEHLHRAFKVIQKYFNNFGKMKKTDFSEEDLINTRDLRPTQTFTYKSLYKSDPEKYRKDLLRDWHKMSVEQKKDLLIILFTTMDLETLNYISVHLSEQYLADEFKTIFSHDELCNIYFSMTVYSQFVDEIENAYEPDVTPMTFFMFIQYLGQTEPLDNLLVETLENEFDYDENQEEQSELFLYDVLKLAAAELFSKK